MTDKTPQHAAVDPDVLFPQAGWWIPGSLLPNWGRTFQANFNDMAPKLAQLQLNPIVPGEPPDQDLGFYFSEAEYDFIQLLAPTPTSDTQKNSMVLPAANIVAYSIWMASQGWAHFSPIPIFEVRAEHVPGKPSASAINRESTYPAGWYLPGKLSQAWFQDPVKNNKLANKARAELNIEDLSPFYLTQSTLYDCVQMVTIAPNNVGRTSIMAYLRWFNANGFGSLSAIPFLGPSLVSNSLLLAGKTP
jgi:hypothetical protein